jgi:hypothetical protein
MELISKDNSGNGNGMANTSGKEVSFILNGKSYRGTYIFDGGKTISTIQTGSATGTANAYAYGNTRTDSAMAFGSGYSSTYIPGSGNGKAIATSGDDTLRCEFKFDQGTGLGICKRNNGSEYDLIVR